MSIVKQEINGLEIPVIVYYELLIDQSKIYIITPYNCEYHHDYIMDNLADEHNAVDLDIDYVADKGMIAIFLFIKNIWEDNGAFFNRILDLAVLIADWKYLDKHITKKKQSQQRWLSCFY